MHSPFFSGYISICFYINSCIFLQGMMNLITESADTMLNSWKSRIESEGGIADIKIDQDMRSFSGDVISRACFGSNFSKGEEIFKRLRALQEAASKKVLSSGIPFLRYYKFKMIFCFYFYFFSAL